ACWRYSKYPTSTPIPPTPMSTMRVSPMRGKTCPDSRKERVRIFLTPSSRQDLGSHDEDDVGLLMLIRRRGKELAENRNRREQRDLGDRLHLQTIDEPAEDDALAGPRDDVRRELADDERRNREARDDDGVRVVETRDFRRDLGVNRS